VHGTVWNDGAQESEQSVRLNGAQQLADEQHQIYIRGGFQAVLGWKLERRKQPAAKRYVSAIEFAKAYAQLKRKEETIRYLELAYEQTRHS
jgi:hypothetical protein